MVKEVITNFDTSRAPGPDYIKELWAWTFIHTSWTIQYVSDGVFFSRLLEGLIGDSSI